MDKIPLCRMYVDDEIKKAAMDVIDSGWYVKGENSRLLGREFAAFCSAKHGVCASSGTTAILMALKAFGIGKGDEVIVPSATFIATVNPIILLGGTPVFADINPETNTMDVMDAEEKITSRTKAVMPVHLYGHPAEMQPIMEMAREHDLTVIADACQAHGAMAFGRKVGTIADAACFSFFPSKNMSVAGEGGIVTTNDPGMAEKMEMIRDHGRKDRDTSVIFGLNLRLSEIHAAIGRVQLKHLARWVEAKRKNAAHYSDALAGIGDIITPIEKSWAKHSYYVYVVKTGKRDALQQYLKAKGIASGVHYRIPVHRQPFILDRLKEVTLPKTDEWAGKVLSLPLDPQISSEEIERVADEVANFFKT